MTVGSVVIGYLQVAGFSAIPAEAQAPLVVYADGMLPRPIAFQRLKPIPRWHQQIVQLGGIGEHEQLSASGRNKVSRKPLGGLPRCNGLYVAALE